MIRKSKNIIIFILLYCLELIKRIKVYHNISKNKKNIIDKNQIENDLRDNLLVNINEFKITLTEKNFINKYFKDHSK